MGGEARSELAFRMPGGGACAERMGDRRRVSVLGLACLLPMTQNNKHELQARQASV